MIDPWTIWGIICLLFPASRFLLPAAGYRDGTLMIFGSPSNSPLNWAVNLVALEKLLTG